MGGRGLLFKKRAAAHQGGGQTPRRCSFFHRWRGPVTALAIPPLKIRDLTSVAVEVPMTQAPGTGKGIITKAPPFLSISTSGRGARRACLWRYLREAMPASRPSLSPAPAIT